MSTPQEDYIPTTEEVREQYAWGFRDPERDWEWEKSDAKERAEFDRWLAEHDRQTAAKAWEDGKNDMLTYQTHDRRKIKLPYPTNPYEQKEQS